MTNIQNLRVFIEENPCIIQRNIKVKIDRKFDITKIPTRDAMINIRLKNIKNICSVRFFGGNSFKIAEFTFDEGWGKRSRFSRYNLPDLICVLANNLHFCFEGIDDYSCEMTYDLVTFPEAPSFWGFLHGEFALSYILRYYIFYMKVSGKHYEKCENIPVFIREKRKKPKHIEDFPEEIRKITGLCTDIGKIIIDYYIGLP